MDEAIRTEKLTKRFGKFTAVDGIDLSICKGELFGLLGVNGAGKTTTIRMLSCLSGITSGNAFIGGHSIATEKNAVKRMIAVSPQETSVAPNLTVRENLAFIAKIYGVGAERVDKIIETYSLSDVAGKRAKLLSGGWQRRLSIAMAMVSDPEVLFLDEPTLGLDVLSRRELWNQISKLKGRVTIVLTTHYLEEAEELCDRIAVMSKGKILALGTTAELEALTGTATLEDAFVKLAGGENAL